MWIQTAIRGLAAVMLALLAPLRDDPSIATDPERLAARTRGIEVQ